jgi:hypothetical protein
MNEFNLKARYNDKHLKSFANQLMQLSSEIGFKVSARGWAYIMEQKRMINKDEFDKVNKLINTCRKKGFLPIDFVAEDSARLFKGVETVSNGTVKELFVDWVKWTKGVADHFDLDWWENETHYIQMVVEKVDLISLFEPVCRKFHIPIANSKGWSSMLQRAEYARRFKEAEDKGMQCVLLYCGDHDPDGLRISEFLRKNLEDISDITWSNREEGYNPENLIIDRFGLNYDFIQRNGFTWIDNLITGAGKNLASPKHSNFHLPYVQEYLRDIGERKCEANVIVTLPRIAREMCQEAIEFYLGEDASSRFSNKRRILKADFKDWMVNNKIEKKVNKLIDFTQRIIEKENQ